MNTEANASQAGDEKNSGTSEGQTNHHEEVTYRLPDGGTLRKVTSETVSGETKNILKAIIDDFGDRLLKNEKPTQVSVSPLHEENIQVLKNDLYQILKGGELGASSIASLVTNDQNAIRNLSEVFSAGAEEALKDVPDVISTYEHVRWIIPILLEHILQGVFEHVYGGQENAEASDVQRLEIVRGYASSIEIMNRLLHNTFPSRFVSWEEFGRRLQPQLETLSTKDIIEMSDYIATHPQFKKEHDTVYKKYHARQLIGQELMPEFVTPEICSWYIEGIGRDRDVILSHCDKARIPKADVIRETMDQNGEIMKQVASEFFPKSPLFSSEGAETHEKETEDLPSMTKAEVSVLFNGITTALIAHERQQNPEMDDVDIEHAVGVLRPQMDLLIKRCPEILTRDHDDFLKSLVSMALQISVETTEAGLTEKQWQTLTQSQKSMPLKHQYILEISEILKREAQHACRIIQEKLEIPTISCQELLDVLASAQGYTDIINDDLPLTLKSIEKAHPQSFKKLSELGDRLRSLSERITTNLPMRIDTHVANRYIIFSLTLRGFLIKELGEVNNTAGASLGQKILEATTKAEAALQRLFPLSAKQEEKVRDEDLSFGLEGEGPFDREELKLAIHKQITLANKETPYTISSFIFNKRLKTLCPERIQKLSDVSHLMHWLKGFMISFDIVSDETRQVLVAMTYLDPIFERIGQRFGVEGITLEADSLKAIAKPTDTILSIEEITEVIEKFLNDQELKRTVRLGCKKNNLDRNSTLVSRYLLCIQSLVDVLVKELPAKLPEGIRSLDEVFMLEGAVFECLGLLVIAKVQHNPEIDKNVYKKILRDIYRKHWTPVFEDFKKRLNTPLPDTTEQDSPVEKAPTMTNIECVRLYSDAMKSIVLETEDAQTLEEIFASEDGEACLASYEAFNQNQHSLLNPVTPEWTIDESLDSLDKTRVSFKEFSDALTALNPELGSRIWKQYEDAFTRFELSVHEYFVNSSYPK